MNEQLKPLEQKASSSVEYISLKKEKKKQPERGFQIYHVCLSSSTFNKHCATNRNTSVFFGRSFKYNILYLFMSDKVCLKWLVMFPFMSYLKSKGET